MHNSGLPVILQIPTQPPRCPPISSLRVRCVRLRHSATCNMPNCLLALLICGLVLVGNASSAEPTYSKDIRPILAARCDQCHGVDEKSANVNFAAIADDKSAARQRKLWRKAIAQLEAGDMPPADAPQLKPEEKTQLLAWLSARSTKSIATIRPIAILVRRSCVDSLYPNTTARFVTYWDSSSMRPLRLA